ncbi:hypothetical protein [Bosea sp. PAMC 26642]|uniref:hypothetical protein n=1 Tax=Bosea sp. (strain PAMC 26642) TaxID=1792307 RepID=UPI0007700B38|nr:hypothetical protein [Bosea sp. PAMC 26642]AMJ59377.1 hypothetical protein AXW83_02825 [Bosea sp. PAMC 26642]
MLALPIEDELDALRVQERIHDLAGCHEDSPEEVELFALVESLEAWEAKCRQQPSEDTFTPISGTVHPEEMPKANEIKPITTLDEYADATRRIAELASSSGGAKAEEELKSLVAAVEKWDNIDQEEPPR